VPAALPGWNASTSATAPGKETSPPTAGVKSVGDAAATDDAMPAVIEDAMLAVADDGIPAVIEDAMPAVIEDAMLAVAEDAVPAVADRD
jgi:hypothetical protein